MMFRFFFRSHPIRTKESSRRVRLAVEQLESRDCPSSPQLLLEAQVAPNHFVKLTGTLTDDDRPAGGIVTFSGAVSGQATVAADGTFSFATQDASLGEVSAVAVDEGGNYSNTASAAISVPAPVLYLTLLNYSDACVTLAGTVQDIDPGAATVSISGLASASAAADSNGDFILTTPLAGTGAIDAVTTDLWGQSSNTAVVDVASVPTAPAITLTAQVLAGHEAKLTGTVTDQNPSGVVVTFSGAVTGSTVTDANGNFTYDTQAASLGAVSAVGVDKVGASTNTASATLALAAPSVTLSIDSVTSSTVTLSGAVTDLDPAGATVAITGVANATVVTDAAGNFLVTTALTGPGAITATATDRWGQSSSAGDDANQATQTVGSLPTPGGPEITLAASVQPGQEATLSGHVNDSQTAGIVVTFSGAVTGSTITDADGNFSFTTTGASLGTVYAVAADSAHQSSNTASATIATPPPTIAASITTQSSTTVTITGKVTDVDAAGEVVHVGGATTGSTTCDSTGNFSFTVAASLTGDIELSTTDDWGQVSTTADVDVSEQPPLIQGFAVVFVNPGIWAFQGQVLGTAVAGLPVNFGGFPAIAALTTPVSTNGSFYVSTPLPPNLDTTATALVINQEGQQSNLATTLVQT